MKLNVAFFYVANLTATRHKVLSLMTRKLAHSWIWIVSDWCGWASGTIDLHPKKWVSIFFGFAV